MIYGNGISKYNKSVRQNNDSGILIWNMHMEYITPIVKLNLKLQCLGFVDYSDSCILVKGTITVANTATAGAGANNISKKGIFKNCAPFSDSISKINNSQVDNTKDIDEVIPMFNLLQYSDSYSKPLGSLFPYYRDKPALNNDAIVDFADNTTDSFKFREKITGQMGYSCTKNGTMSFNDVGIVSVKEIDYRIHYWSRSKEEAIHVRTNSDLLGKSRFS